jgi:lactate permease
MAALLLQMSPIGLVIALILLVRRPPVQAALAGVAVVFLLWGMGAARRCRPPPARRSSRTR